MVMKIPTQVQTQLGWGRMESLDFTNKRRKLVLRSGFEKLSAEPGCRTGRSNCWRTSQRSTGVISHYAQMPIRRSKRVIACSRHIHQPVIECNCAKAYDPQRLEGHSQLPTLWSSHSSTLGKTRHACAKAGQAQAVGGCGFYQRN